MFNRLRLFAIFLPLVLLVACAEPEKSPSADAARETVQEVISKAEATYQEAKSLGHAWTKTSGFIHAAKSALAAGNKEDAKIAADRALYTARASVNQANKEKDAWRDRVIK